jgi:hypothetical protein
VPDLPGLETLPQISLPEVLAAAAATTRVDRKYLLTVDAAHTFLDRLPGSLRLLSIDGRLTTAYRSTYFDTPDLRTCRAHIQGRRRRWKARSRLYVEDGLCRLELKVRDGSGLTRKFFHPTSADEYGQMTRVAEAFFGEELLGQGLDPAELLAPAVEVAYERATLADPETGTRVTIDSGVRGTRDHQAVEVDPGRLIVETKGTRTAGVADRLLSQLGARPVSFSKYAASASLMDPRIPDNDVRRMVGCELHVTRDTHQPEAGQSAPTRASQVGPARSGTAHLPPENFRRTA